ncbi:MAG: GTPase HflX [Chlamydiae bacterium]|nr:GTPase HflX [Chlamydiota bacterium]
MTTKQNHPPVTQGFDLHKVKTVILIGIYQSGSSKEKCDEYLEELHRLCETFGILQTHRMGCSIKKFDAKTYLGSGKVAEIAALRAELGYELVIFDDEISPHQQRNLEALIQCPVIDRTELIIEVFAQRAQTREARLQIELAKIKYQVPRLRRLWTHLSRQSTGGGGFLKGEGEKQIEIDRRLLRRRVDVLKKEIEEVVAQRHTQRAARLRSGIPTFAIIGYTNAGKSTLLKTLTQADVLVEDKLFATLDTTTRKFILPNRQEILLIDTVGFIRKIPHTLVAAFKSTLEEAVHTDILIHLIDVSHPNAEEHAEATLQVLKELGAAEHPIITVFNKIDACPNPMIMTKLKIKYHKTIQISALYQTGLEDLAQVMVEELSKLRRVVYLRIPQSQYALVAELMKEGRVIFSDYEDNDVLLQIEIPARLEYKVVPFMTERV